MVVMVVVVVVIMVVVVRVLMVVGESNLSGSALEVKAVFLQQ